MAVKEKKTVTTSALEESKPRNKQEARRLWMLIFGDILVFLIFSVIGRQSHGEDTGLTAVLKVVWTALPFAISWFAIAPFMGAFRRELMTEPRQMARKTGFAWLAAWPIGVILHFVFEQHLPTVVSAITFGLVTLISNTVLLFIWRIPFAMTNHTKDLQARLAPRKK
ncbi:DUF3054 domain-containing protein [Dictyobacter aurantiacus]|uniref:DUF3054 domain-containing protein n=1 Tax=Dictyobacter aurantiacus TaxID=1936993 RepID=A0A401ZBM7_9CHLR|nr:DUF3054 domain-containing protein [Dictyobacter aurantiacus]GCE04275.1 hypothetical protein KDAU_16040 [Dictyobacter aurantiacus]